jgi:hypothetical protein
MDLAHNSGGVESEGAAGQERSLAGVSLLKAKERFDVFNICSATVTPIYSALDIGFRLILNVHLSSVVEPLPDGIEERLWRCATRETQS